MIASVYESDYCTIVSEPAPFDPYYIRLTVEILQTLGIPFGLIVNKAGIGDTGVYE